jgi:hypothetical protein
LANAVKIFLASSTFFGLSRGQIGLIRCDGSVILAEPKVRIGHRELRHTAGPAPWVLGDDLLGARNHGALPFLVVLESGTLFLRQRDG